MLFRAFDCGTYDSRDPDVTVWFEADSREQACERLTQLLTLAWDVPPKEIYTGNLDNIYEIEARSVQPPAAGDRRWFESGSLGDWPCYARAPELVMVRSAQARKLADARRSAQTHARYLAEQCELRAVEAAEQAGQPDSRAEADWRYNQDEYQKFAAGVIGYDN